MSEKYIYGQPLYGQDNIQYEGMEGLQFGTYESTNYQKGVNMNQIQYQHQHQQQPVYLNQNQGYTQQTYLREDENGQLYEYQPQEKAHGYGTYYQNAVHQPQQQNIHYQQQPQIIQQPKYVQQQARITKQIAQQRPNVQPYSNIQQPPFPSRNPHLKQQYQNPQNMPQMNQPQQNINITETKYIPQNFTQEKPSIEPDFQPTIPIANSVLTQSKIPFQPNQNPPMNPQSQMPSMSNMPQQSYVVPRRNPNANLNQYGYMNNDSHFVNAPNPEWGVNDINPNPQEQNQNIMKKISGEPMMLHKQSGLSHKSLEQDQLLNTNEEPKIGSNSGIQNVNMSGSQNMGKSEVENINAVNNIDTNLDDNFLESKMTHEEFPIEEKIPEQNNLNDNENYQQGMDQKPLEASVDIDENLAHLPTVNSIMKGRSEMLPPPKKKKYQ